MYKHMQLAMKVMKHVPGQVVPCQYDLRYKTLDGRVRAKYTNRLSGYFYVPPDSEFIKYTNTLIYIYSQQGPLRHIQA